MIRFLWDDGGREESGYKGTTGDCVVRAVAIATGLDYRQVYDDIHERQRVFYATSRARHARSARAQGTTGVRSSPRDGVLKNICREYLADLGWTWTPTMGIGTGTRVHLRADELPAGVVIVSLSKHLATVIDGVLYDTHDCSRDGTRAVYGHWTKPVTTRTSRREESS